MCLIGTIAEIISWWRFPIYKYTLWAHIVNQGGIIPHKNWSEATSLKIQYRNIEPDIVICEQALMMWDWHDTVLTSILVPLEPWIQEKVQQTLDEIGDELWLEISTMKIPQPQFQFFSGVQQ